MSFDRTALARQALHAAQQIRMEQKKSVLYPLCIYDLVSDMKVDLWFQENASLEGMYAQTPKARIVIGSERPSPRQRYTCAHELGHHVFGHGTRIDQFCDNAESASSQDSDEFLAQTFAGFLLMPKLAIANAFKERSWSLAEPTKEQIYRCASLFGVGYDAMLNHLCFSLNVLKQTQRDSLSCRRLKDIRSAMTEDDIDSPLTVVDVYWKGRAIDLEVNDFLLAPTGCLLEGENLNFVRNVDRGAIWRAVKPGRSRLSAPTAQWASYVRVSRRNFHGRGMFRNLAETNDDE